MSSEVYKKISQSRRRYLSELNQVQKKNIQPGNKANENIEKAESLKVNNHPKLQLSSAINTFANQIRIGKRIRNILQNFPVEEMKGFINKRYYLLQKWIFANNQRFSGRSERLMDNFVNYSNRIFEDRYENPNHDNANLRLSALCQNHSSQVVREIEDAMQTDNFLTEFSESRLSEILDRARREFLKIWNNIIFSIEFESETIDFQTDIETIQKAKEKKLILNNEPVLIKSNITDYKSFLTANINIENATEVDVEKRLQTINSVLQQSIVRQLANLSLPNLLNKYFSIQIFLTHSIRKILKSVFLIS